MRHSFAHTAARAAAGLLAVASLGGVLVAQTRAPEPGTYHITTKNVPPANGDHRIDDRERHVFAADLKQPYGLALHKGHAHVANTG